jgi:hypothetical protein
MYDNRAALLGGSFCFVRKNRPSAVAREVAATCKGKEVRRVGKLLARTASHRDYNKCT